MVAPGLTAHQHLRCEQIQLFIALARGIEGWLHVPSAFLSTVPSQQACQFSFTGVQPKIRRAGDTRSGATVRTDPSDGLDEPEIAFRVLDERLSAVHEDVSRPAATQRARIVPALHSPAQVSPCKCGRHLRFVVLGDGWVFYRTPLFHHRIGCFESSQWRDVFDDADATAVLAPCRPDGMASTAWSSTEPPTGPVPRW